MLPLPRPLACNSEQGNANVIAQYRHDEDGFGVRLIAHVTIPVGEITVSVAGEHSLPDKYAPLPRTVQQFGNEVTVMAVFPYLRKAVSTVSGRVFGTPLFLPMVRRGDIALDVEEE